MYSDSQKSPLSRLLEDDTLTVMEQLLPFCPPPMAKILALQMKLMEMKKIMEGFENEPYLKACGFEKDSSDMEGILRSLRESVSEETAGQIDEVLQMLSTLRLFRQWQSMFRSHPELMQLLSQSMPASISEKEPAMASDAFTDPSLFLLLNSMKNGEDMNTDTVKRLLDMAMKHSHS